MIDFIFQFFEGFLIEIMTFILFSSFFFRWLSYKQSNKDEIYFSHFARELSSTINEDRSKKHKIINIENYLNNILGRVNKRIPFRKKQSKEKKHKEQHALSLKDYVSAKHGVIASIQNEISVFSSTTSPNFTQLTDRVLNDDENWSKVFGVFPVNIMTRLLSALPLIFIMIGFLGTFLGASQALAQISFVDFKDIEGLNAIVNQFISQFTLAMHASIVGVFYSLIMIGLNTFFPVDLKRERTSSKVENALQELWYHVQTDPNKLSTEEQLQATREILADIHQHLTHKNIKVS